MFLNYFKNLSLVSLDQYGERKNNSRINENHNWIKNTLIFPKPVPHLTASANHESIIMKNVLATTKQYLLVSHIIILSIWIPNTLPSLHTPTIQQALHHVYQVMFNGKSYKQPAVAVYYTKHMDSIRLHAIHTSRTWSYSKICEEKKYLTQCVAGWETGPIEKLALHYTISS